jgi:serine-type D-Ala-D-Ala endopeptidase (penicillin-binding protein 7)
MPPQNLPLAQIPSELPPKPKDNPALALIVCSVCLVFIGGIFFLSTRERGTMITEAPATTTAALSHDQAFDRLTLEAKAVYVIDVRDDKVLYAQNSDAPLPLASITKLLTALVAFQSLPENTVITISPESLSTEGESGLAPGEVWRLRDLLGFMLITSSNDAATALKNAYRDETNGSFISAMNAEAARLGMSQSSFQNETGLDVGSRASNTGSARDVATLLTAAARILPDALDATRHDAMTFVSMDGVSHAVKNTNELANMIPWAVGAKTGFTDIAGGNLAISFDVSLGHPVIIVVLGSSREGRFSDMGKLVDATLEAIQAP